MSDGAAELQAMADRLRGVGRIVADYAPEGASTVKAEIAKSIAAGTSPSGEAWAPKKDGGQPLVNAAAAVDVRATGTSLVVEVTGPEAWHNRGTKRTPRRQIIPSGALPPAIATALREGLAKRFREATK